MNLEQNIKGLCSKHGIHFQDFLGDFEIDSVHELSIFDLEAICDEYDVTLESLLFKSLIIESELQNKLEHIKLLILDVDGVMTDGGMSYFCSGILLELLSFLLRMLQASGLYPCFFAKS